MESSETPFDQFPPQVREDIDGLTWLGYLEDHFSYCGHDFVLRTLRGDEELLAALVTKEYVDTLGQVKAHVWATIGLAQVSVDGDSEFCPSATHNKVDFARARLQWTSSKWFWPVAAKLYEHYNLLLRRQQEALDALEDFCSGSPHMPLPFADSLTDRAPSPEEDIREYLDPEGSAPSNSDSSPI